MANSAQRSEEVDFKHEISDQLQILLRAFKSILEMSVLKLQENESQVRHNLWVEELGRLRIWAVNIGAHQRGNTSLDFRLRDASHVRNQILDLLEDLGTLLDDAVDILRPNSAVARDVTVSSDSLFDDDKRTEYQQVAGSVSSRIDCLFEVSLAVRRPAKLDHIVGLRKVHWGPFAQHDLQHVTAKFPKANGELLAKLASATTFRRGVLKYYEIHRRKYAKDAELFFEDDDQADHGSLDLDASLAPATDYQLNRERTRLAYSASNRSMASLLGQHNSLTISIPSKLHKRKPFECPYCHYLLDTYEPQDFVRHVFENITPYQCIAPECIHSHDLLASRSAWLHHLESTHRRWWNESAILPCLMCGESDYSGKSFDKHVARHLEDLAIFTLPRTEEEVEDEKIKEKTSTVDSMIFDDHPRRIELDTEGLGPILGLLEDYDEKETLSDSFKSLGGREAGEFFIRGRVFAIIWHKNVRVEHNDLSRNSVTDEKPFHVHVLFRPKKTFIYSFIRRYVVIKQRHGYCWAIPIVSYQGKGLTAKHIPSEEIQAHAILYADGTVPRRVKGEPRLIKEPIKVKMTEGRTLSAAERIKFDKPQAIDWNIKVRNDGLITSQTALRRLMTYFTEEMFRDEVGEAPAGVEI